MEIMRCPKGHFYDKEKADTCPVCAGNSANSDTRPVDDFILPHHEGVSIRLEGIVSITYDEGLDHFVVTPEHASLVRLNGYTLTKSTIVKNEDMLMLGNTQVYLTPPEKRNTPPDDETRPLQEPDVTLPL